MSENLGSISSEPYEAPVNVATPPSPEKGFALGALVVGIVAFLLGWVPVVGLLSGAAAIVLGFLALKRAQSKPMALAGIVLGALGALTSLIMTAVLAFAGDSFQDGLDDAVAAATVSASPEVTVQEVEATMIAIPDVTGMTVSVARDELEDAGFVVDLGAATTADIVTGTAPAGGTEAAEGSTVTIAAEAPQPVQVEVPDLVGLTVVDARAALVDAGLGVKFDGTDADIVTASDPAAGSTVDEGSAVTLTVKAAPLDLDAFSSLSEREFGLIGKDPDAHIGEQVVVYGSIFQYDSFTGKCGFMAYTGHQREEYSFDYDQNSMAFAGDGDQNCPELDDIIEGDAVKMWTTIMGAYDYDTQIGGTSTALLLDISKIEYLASGD